MENMRVLRPGQNGTKQLVKEYGEKLICVRYRYDYKNKKVLKTIELIVSEQDWQPPRAHPNEEKPSPLTQRIPIRTVGISVAWHEKDLQQAVRNAGGRWNKQEKLWYVAESVVHQLGLEERIVKG